MRYECTYVTTPAMVWCILPQRKTNWALKHGISPRYKNVFQIQSLHKFRVICAVKAGDHEMLEQLVKLSKLDSYSVITAAVPVYYKCLREVPESQAEKMNLSVYGPQYKHILIIPNKIKKRFVYGLAEEFIELPEIENEDFDSEIDQNIDGIEDIEDTNNIEETESDAEDNYEMPTMVFTETGRDTQAENRKVKPEPKRAKTEEEQVLDEEIATLADEPDEDEDVRLPETNDSEDLDASEETEEMDDYQQDEADQEEPEEDMPDEDAENFSDMDIQTNAEDLSDDFSDLDIDDADFDIDDLDMLDDFPEPEKK